MRQEQIQETLAQKCDLCDSEELFEQSDLIVHKKFSCPNNIQEH